MAITGAREDSLELTYHFETNTMGYGFYAYHFI